MGPARYDHVAPPQLDRNGLAFRVPLIVASRFAKSNPIAGVHAGINAHSFLTSVPLDTKPLDDTPEER